MTTTTTNIVQAKRRHRVLLSLIDKFEETGQYEPAVKQEGSIQQLRSTLTEMGVPGLDTMIFEVQARRVLFDINRGTVPAHASKQLIRVLDFVANKNEPKEQRP